MITNATTRPAAIPTCTPSNVSFRTALHISSVVNELLPLGGASVLRSPHIIAVGKTTANHFVDLRRVGGPTHKCNEMALRLKTSRHFMNCFPMLLVCPFIGKPTRFDRAQRAFHHRDEAQPHLLLLIASSPVRHHPFFSWCLHV